MKRCEGLPKKELSTFQIIKACEIITKGKNISKGNLKVGTNENGSACGRWQSIGI
jgi:hypothetical protein